MFMRKCNNCGASLDDDALFCTSCGNKVEATSGRKCPSCGAPLDEDSLFCTGCGTKVGSEISQTNVIPPHSIQSQPIVSESVPAMEYQSEQQLELDNEPRSNTTMIAIITALAVLICGVGGYLYYDNVYLPEKIDREAARYYTMANAVVLRSTKSAGADYNKIGSLPYGTELITYEHDSEWSRVKVNTPNADGNKQDGYVASQFLLGKSDFFLLNSVFGDQESKENVMTTKCRIAVLNYYKNKGYIGKIDDEIRKDAGITIVPNNDNQWQIFCRPKDVKPNTVLFKRLYDRNSRFTDFAVVIKNIVTGERKLLYFYFDEDETPHFFADQDAPSEGYIKDIVMTNYGDLTVSYSY